jgi:hypothetical protein
MRGEKAYEKRNIYGFIIEIFEPLLERVSAWRDRGGGNAGSEEMRAKLLKSIKSARWETSIFFTFLLLLS